MIPNTVGRVFDTQKVARIACVKNDTLSDMDIKDNCFLMLLVKEGNVFFEVGDICFEASAPCVVCFGEREQPRLLRSQGLVCDAVYFHPTFLNVNMTFEQVRGKNYEQLVLSHDMFLLRPFTDERCFVLPLPEEYGERIGYLFDGIENELREQPDWYWSCRSRSYFLEIILILERIYGIIGRDELVSSFEEITEPHLRSAIMYIESHYGEDIGLESIAKAASINHSSLTKLFKSELGVTAIEYLWQYRLSMAKKHLEFTSLPLNDISLRCGFKTVQHFSRRFKADTGLAPKAFRDEAVAKRKAAF